MTALITAIGIHKEYPTAAEPIVALEDVSFVAERGEITLILGPSGAGKTTLLNILGGMDIPTKGVLAVDGENIAAFSRRQRRVYRKDKIGFVFQFYNLDPNLSALENVELATQLSAGRAHDAGEALDGVGLAERKTHRPYQLSGGEQQRVSIARAIAKNPDIILCDEPTGALDYATGKAILQLLQDEARKGNKAVIIATHNNALKDMADHLIHIKNGQIVGDEKNPSPKNIEEIEW